MARTPLQIIKIGILVLVVALTAFTRFYRLPVTYNFHNDEGRDVLIAARMIWESRPTLLGPQTSTGNMYLGPFYYYLIVPPLYLSGFDPVGPAYFVAALAVLTAYLLVSFSYHRSGFLAASVAGLLFALLPGVVNFTRQSWNPNVVPFFSLLLLLLTFQLTRPDKRTWHWLAFGFLTGVLAQLHYVALILPAWSGLYLLLLPQTHRSRLLAVLTAFTGLLIATAPFWLFEFRHGFVNTQAFFTFLTERGGDSTYGSYFTRLANNFISLMDNLVGSKPYRLSGIPRLVISAGWLVVASGLLSRKRNIRFLSLLFPITVFLFSFLDENLQLHYFGFLFPAFALLAGSLFTKSSTTSLKILGVITTLLILSYNLPILSSRLQMDPEAQPIKAQAVSDYIRREAGGQPYNVSPGPTNSRDTTYLYYLYQSELPPSSDQEELLYLICEDGPCQDKDVASPHLYARGPSHPALTDYLGHPYMTDYSGPRNLVKQEHIAYGTWVATIALPL